MGRARSGTRHVLSDKPAWGRRTAPLMTGSLPQMNPSSILGLVLNRIGCEGRAQR